MAEWSGWKPLCRSHVTCKGFFSMTTLSFDKFLICKAFNDGGLTTIDIWECPFPALINELIVSKIEFKMYLVNLNEPDFGSGWPLSFKISGYIRVGWYSGSFDITRRKLEEGSENIVYWLCKFSILLGFIVSKNQKGLWLIYLMINFQNATCLVFFDMIKRMRIDNLQNR